MANENYKNIVIMKYGVHASENVDSILKRKTEEFQKEGKIFWGYGGNTCHPKNQIQPFLKSNVENNEKTYLLLSKTISDFNNSPTKAVEYSLDGINWSPIPENINVIGSKYAIVCGELNECNYKIDLSDYVVPIGNSFGKTLSEYMKFRIDKSCGIFLEQHNQVKSKEIIISYYAEIIEPFAVFVR